MTWEAFWWPNLVQSTLFATISAVVVFAVGLVLRWWWKHWGHKWVRKWAADLLTEQLKDTEDAALKAASNAREAKDASKDAAGEAKTAGTNSREAGAKLEIVGARLVDVIAENRSLGTRLDDFLTANLVLRTTLTQHGIPIPETARINGVVTGEVEAQVITGKHRLYSPETLGIPVVDDPRRE